MFKRKGIQIRHETCGLVGIIKLKRLSVKIRHETSEILNSGDLVDDKSTGLLNSLYWLWRSSRPP